MITLEATVWMKFCLHRGLLDPLDPALLERDGDLAHDWKIWESAWNSARSYTLMKVNGNAPLTRLAAA